MYKSQYIYLFLNKVFNSLGFTMSWFLTLILLSIIFDINLLDARHEKMLPSAVVIGTVYCDACFQGNFSDTSHFISGALVAVECSATSSRPSFREEVKTDNNGKFEVHLPFSVTKQAKKIDGCEAKLVNSSQPHCAVASTATSSSLQLKSRNPSTHIFSAGILSFKPLKKPNLCNQTPKMNSCSKKIDSVESLDPTMQDPKLSTSFPPLDQKYLPHLPPLPMLPPLPRLPSLPPLPGLPFFPPVPKKMPPLLPLNPFEPPPSLDFPLVPFPGLLYPPPPAEAAFQFPFQPSPDFPGCPAADSSSSSKKTFP